MGTKVRMAMQPLQGPGKLARVQGLPGLAS